MASFVNFLKSAFIPSVKAQDEEVENPQATIKVSCAWNFALCYFHSISRLCILTHSTLLLLFLKLDSMNLFPLRNFPGEMSRKFSHRWFIWKIPNMQRSGQQPKANRRELRRGAVRLYGCIKWLCSRKIVLKVEINKKPKPFGNCMWMHALLLSFLPKLFYFVWKTIAPPLSHSSRSSSNKDNAIIDVPSVHWNNQIPNLISEINIVNAIYKIMQWNRDVTLKQITKKHQKLDYTCVFFFIDIKNIE